jgi:hypothetical protein
MNGLSFALGSLCASVLSVCIHLLLDWHYESRARRLLRSVPVSNLAQARLLRAQRVSLKYPRNALRGPSSGHPPGTTQPTTPTEANQRATPADRPGTSVPPAWGCRVTSNITEQQLTAFRLCTRCNQIQATPGRRMCARCRDRAYLTQMRRHGLTIRYNPLDEILADPRVQILRALRRFDWVECVDLFEAMGVSLEPIERNRYSAVLSRLTRGAFAARREPTTSWKPGRQFNLYRITQSGIDELARLMRTDTASAWTDRDAEVSS